MISYRKNFKLAVTDLLILIVSVLFWAGIRSWFPVCAAMGDSVMSCHWAGESLKAVSWLALCLGLVHVFVPDGKIKAGMDIAAAGIQIYALMIPGGIISICGMSDMKCHTTQKWVLVFSLVLLVLAVIDAFLYLARESAASHKRPAKRIRRSAHDLQIKFLVFHQARRNQWDALCNRELPRGSSNGR